MEKNVTFVLNQTNGRSFACQDLRLFVLFGFVFLQGSDVGQKEINLASFQLQPRCICNTWYMTSALLDELFKDLSIEAFFRKV